MTRAADRRLAVALRPAVAVLLVSVAAAGCSRVPQSAAGQPISGPSSPASSTATVPATTAGTSGPATGSSAPASTTRPPSTGPGSTPPASPVASQPDGPGGCASAVLQVRALRASGAAGHQYAFLQFTNTSAKSCSLTGYPGVRLLRAGAPLGPEAQRTGKPISRVQIAPGSSVTARLIDDSTCNAVNSDAVQVIPPNRTEKFVLPLALRGCSLHIDPVGTG